MKVRDDVDLDCDELDDIFGNTDAKEFFKEYCEDYTE